MITFHFITEFSSEINQYIAKGIFKRAINEGTFNLNFISLRDHSFGKHNKIDGYPFSHKKGMLIRADVIYSAITSIPNYESMKIIYPSPKGNVLTQSKTKKMALDCKDRNIIFLSGYYQGIDERILNILPIESVSIGDYVLNSGDTASIVIAETIIRQLPGVLGNADCIEMDTHVKPWFQAPCYTQPVIFREYAVLFLIVFSLNSKK